MHTCTHQAYEANPEIWVSEFASENLDDPDCSSAMKRRMLMAQWLSDAWTDLCTNHPNLIDNAFVKTGFKLALDGSDDGKVEIQGWDSPTPYSFRD
jgi:hypothetical protein